MGTPIPVSAMPGHDPCLGARWIPERSASRLASSGGNAAQGEAVPWVSGLSVASTTFSASGRVSSQIRLTTRANSSLPLLLAGMARLVFASGSKATRTSATPFLAYWQSRLPGLPGRTVDETLLDARLAEAHLRAGRWGCCDREGSVRKLFDTLGVPLEARFPIPAPAHT